MSDYKDIMDQREIKSFIMNSKPELTGVANLRRKASFSARLVKMGDGRFLIEKAHLNKLGPGILVFIRFSHAYGFLIGHSRVQKQIKKGTFIVALPSILTQFREVNEKNYFPVKFGETRVFDEHGAVVKGGYLLRISYDGCILAMPDSYNDELLNIIVPSKRRKVKISCWLMKKDFLDGNLVWYMTFLLDNSNLSVVEKAVAEHDRRGGKKRK